MNARGSVLVIFLIVGINCQSFALQLYLKVFNNDCWNCYAGLNNLRKSCPQLTYNFVFESELAPDSLELKEKFKLSQIQNHRLIFSDSLYSLFGRSNSSEILLVGSFNNVVFRNEMKNFDLQLFQRILHLNEGQGLNLIDSMPGLGKYRMIDYELRNDLILFTDIFQKKYFFSKRTDSIRKVSLTADLIKNTYSATFRKDGIWMLGIIQFMLNEEYDNLTPRLNKVKFKTDSICFMNYMVYEVQVNGSDTIYSPVNCMAEMNVLTCDVKKIHRLPLSHGYELGEDFFKDDRWLYVQVRHGKAELNNSQPLMAKFQIFRDSMGFVGFEKFFLPENYFRYELFRNFNQFYFDHGVFAMLYGEEIYDVREGKMIAIPIDSSRFSGLSNIFDQFSNRNNKQYKPKAYVNITDIFLVGPGSYALLYLYQQEVHQLNFSLTGRLEDKLVCTLSENQDMLYPKFYFDSKYVALKAGRSDYFEIFYTGQ